MQPLLTCPFADIIPLLQDASQSWHKAWHTAACTVRCTHFAFKTHKSNLHTPLSIYSREGETVLDITLCCRMLRDRQKGLACKISRAVFSEFSILRSASLSASAALCCSITCMNPQTCQPQTCPHLVPHYQAEDSQLKLWLQPVISSILGNTLGRQTHQDWQTKTISS